MNNFIKKFVITTMYLSLILIATVPSVITSAKQNDIVIRDLTEEEQALIESGEIVPTVVDDIDAFLEEKKNNGVYKSDTVEINVNPFARAAYSDIGKKNLDGLHTLNCQFQFTSEPHRLGGYYFSSIFNISTWITGVQFPIGATWQEKYTTYEYDYYRRNVDITASGVLSYYIIVDGVGKVAEDNVLVIFPFYARAE